MTVKKLHRWAGLLLALPLILQGVTGSIIAIDPVLERLTTPRIVRAADHPDDIDAIVALARNAAPDLPLQRYRASADGPAIVDFGTQNGRSVEVRVDPVAARVLSTRKDAGQVDAAIRRFHESLMLQSYGGRSVIGWVGVALLFLAITGLWLWWPRPDRFRAALRVSPRSRGWLLQRQLHGAGGAYLVIVLLVQSLSGITLGFPQTARAVFGLPTIGRAQGSEGGQRPVGEDRHRADGGRRPDGAREDAREGHEPDPAALVSAALAAVPSGTFMELHIGRFPRPTSAFLEVADRPMPVAVQFSGRGRVVSVRDPMTEGMAGQTLAWLRAIHYGQVLTPIWPILLAIGGLALPLLSVTGVLMWLKRGHNRQAVTRRALSALPTAGD